MKLLRRGVEEAADIACGLADTLFVFDQRDAHIALAVFAEADAGRDRDVGLLDQQLRELDAAEAGERFRDRRPGKHRGPRRRHLPAGAAEAFHQHVAALFIGFAHFLDAVVRTVQRGGRRHLDRREGAVIQIRLHAAERCNDALVADGKAHAPAGHRVGFRHRREFNRNVVGAGDLQQRRRRIVVEIDFGVSEIRQHDDVVLLGERDKILVEIERRYVSGRVGRIAHHQHLRLRDRVLDRTLDGMEESRRRFRRH